jgi:chromosome segregation ATPase
MLQRISGSIQRRWRVFGLVGSLALALAILQMPTARADTANDAIAPVEQFSHEVDNLKQTFNSLNRQIEESAATIDRMQSGESSRQEVAQLREIVTQLLAAVADNGTVAQLGDKALKHAQDKLAALQHDDRFTADQRKHLIEEWTKLQKEIGDARGELETARGQFAGLLRTLQLADDYVAELIEIRQGKEALKVVKDLAKQLHDASSMLSNFINAINAPGT